MEHPTRLSEDIRNTFLESEGVVTVRDVLDRVEQKSFGLLLVILALPSAAPVPAPGYSVPFGIVLATLAVQMILLRPHPWLPERVLRRRIKTKSKKSALQRMLRFIAFFERFLKPRWGWFYTRKSFLILTGTFVLLCAISMMIPLLLTNTLPAIGIFLMGLGLLEEDSVFGFAGMVMAVIGVAVTIAVVLAVAHFGMGGVDVVREWIRGLFP